ncbi:MAG: hypothetical protein ABSG77_13880 [Candidatus Acidiferrum sp.]|jgi:hypothetical protein
MDAKQNVEIERMASSAKNGGRFRWQDVPLYNADGGPANAVRDLVEVTGPTSGAWWEHREPNFLSRQGERFASHGEKGKYGRDDRDERCGAERENTAVRDSEGYEEYMPQAGETISDWLKRFAEAIDLNIPSRRPLFEALKNFLSGSGTNGKLASELPQATIRKFVELICNASEEAA